MARIPLHNPHIPESAHTYIREVIDSGHLDSNGPFTARCENWLQTELGVPRALLTNSGTTALEIAALLLDIRPGDEIIMPAWTFPSTASAFVHRGAIPVFVDIRKDTLNLDETRIAEAITSATRAVVAVHYAGVSCEMDAILALAEKNGLAVIEDAAQGFLARYRDQYLGTLSSLGVLSFHKTKASTCGEGGALLINDPRLIHKAEIIRDKGVNRQAWQRGEVPYYEWSQPGLGGGTPETTAALLLAQLEEAYQERDARLLTWQYYFDEITRRNLPLRLPAVPEKCGINGHLFAIRAESQNVASHIQKAMLKANIEALPHYMPLDQASAGKCLLSSHKTLPVTQDAKATLLRLPLWRGLDKVLQNNVITTLTRAMP
jgi:dTDP-4-amino-4,6-dideoxygalactose transaminase